MKTNYNKPLTRQMLEEMGIVSIVWDDEANDWTITRFWKKSSTSRTKRFVDLKIHVSTRKHKYTASKTYPVINFSYNNKQYCFPLSRIIYAWFNNEVKQGYVIDHIDNNPFNNKLENLQMITPEENLKKRFIDNPNGCKNQWDAIRRKKYEKKIIEKYYEAQAELVDAVNKLTAVSALGEEALDKLTDIKEYIKQVIC